MNDYINQVLGRVPQATQAPLNPWENAVPYPGAPEGADKTQTITFQKKGDGSLTVTNKVQNPEMEELKALLGGM